MKNDSWDDQQRKYWDNIASKEYKNLYSNKWSRLEDSTTEMQFKKVIRYKTQINLLDLACGQGFGCGVVSKLRHECNIKYTGIDLSKRMISEAMKYYPKEKFYILNVCNLGRFSNENFNCISAFNASMSYTCNITKTLNEIYRILDRNGVAFLSFLNKNSLRRKVHGLKNKKEQFGTRGLKNHKNPFVFTYSIKDLKNLLKHNYKILNIFGISCFGGIIEYSMLWKLDQLISKYNPGLCHILNVVVKKN